MAKLNYISKEKGQKSTVYPVLVEPKNKRFTATTTIIVAFFALLSFLSPNLGNEVVFAQTKAKKDAKETAVPSKAEGGKAGEPAEFNMGDFTFTSQNRRDPFEPIGLLKIKRDIDSKSIKKGYELEELKLVGILKSGRERYAMMEDLQGRGINFKKGDFVNKNLWVLDILEGSLILGYRLKGEMRRMEIEIPKR